MLLKIIVSVLFILALVKADDASVVKTACIDNNASACYNYALLLITGENAKIQDLHEEGIGYMRKACVLGESKGCDELGKHYFKIARYQAAVPYLEKSCNNGLKVACESMGIIYRDGHDTRPNDEKARVFFEKACALDSGDACYNVAIIYRGGFGIPKNRATEKRFYQLSCKTGLKAGCDRFTELDNEDKGIKTGIFSVIKSLFK
jgi:TPR repeat protein